jgi:hypothetical protein
MDFSRLHPLFLDVHVADKPEILQPRPGSAYHVAVVGIPNVTLQLLTEYPFPRDMIAEERDAGDPAFVTRVGNSRGGLPGVRRGG